MFKVIIILVPILLASIVYCSRLPQDQEIVDKLQTTGNRNKHNRESKQESVKALEKEKDLKLLRKNKRLKEINYKKALESILPGKDSDGYRRFFEDLINNSGQETLLDLEKDNDDVGLTDKFVDSDKHEDTDGSQVEEVEMIVERITSTDNSNETNNVNNDSQRTVTDSSIDDSDEGSLESREQKAMPSESETTQPLANSSNDVEVISKGRSGMPQSGEIEPLIFSNLEEKPLSDPYLASQFNNVRVPPYATTMVRNNAILQPALYTVQRSSPGFENIPSMTRHFNRAISPEVLSRSASDNPSESSPKFIDDYNDDSTNTYKFSPRRSFSTLPEPSPKIDMLSQFRTSIQPSVNNQMLLKDHMYPPTAYFPQAQLYPGVHRSFYTIHS